MKPIKKNNQIGQLPSPRKFVFDEGAIGNYSYLTVPLNAANPAGALVVINHLMSPSQAKAPRQ